MTKTEKKNTQFKIGDLVIVRCENTYLGKYNESSGIILEEVEFPEVNFPWVDNIPNIYSVLVSPLHKEQPEVVAFYATELTPKDSVECTKNEEVP